MAMQSEQRADSIVSPFAFFCEQHFGYQADLITNLYTAYSVADKSCEICCRQAVQNILIS